jgi:hypothetical protein
MPDAAPGRSLTLRDAAPTMRSIPTQTVPVFTIRPPKFWLAGGCVDDVLLVRWLGRSSRRTQ